MLQFLLFGPLRSYLSNIKQSKLHENNQVRPHYDPSLGKAIQHTRPHPG